MAAENFMSPESDQLYGNPSEGLFRHIPHGNKIANFSKKVEQKV